MKKLSLDLDELKVDSFATDRESTAQGTVKGHADTADGTCLITCGSDGGCCYATYEYECLTDNPRLCP